MTWSSRLVVAAEQSFCLDCERRKKKQYANNSTLAASNLRIDSRKMNDSPEISQIQPTTITKIQTNEGNGTIQHPPQSISVSARSALDATVRFSSIGRFHELAMSSCTLPLFILHIS